MRADKTQASDEDDWNIFYPSDIISWLVDVENSFNWRLSPIDILETERRYPGLIDKMSIEVWQRDIIEKQVQAESNGKP